MSRRKQGDYAGQLYDGHRRNTAKDRKTLIERLYLRMFTEIAMARFQWTGLPDSVDERFLELTLFRQALSVFYKDTDYGKFMSLKASGAGPINMYDNPTSFVVVGNQMFGSKQLSYKDCVPIWANGLRHPDYDIALLYSSKLADIERTIEINLMAMRHPYMLFVDENEKLSVMNAMRQVQEGQPVIVGSPGLAQAMENKSQLLDMRLDKEVVVNLQLVKTKLWNECLTMLGINNANQDKRERLVVSEVSANNSQVLMARNVSLNARRLAAEMINDKYDLEIKVDWNVDIEMIAAEKQIAENVKES